MTTSKQWTTDCQLNSHQHIVHRWRGGGGGCQGIPSAAGLYLLCVEAISKMTSSQKQRHKHFSHFSAVNNKTLMAE